MGRITREQMVEALVELDILKIKEDMKYGDVEHLTRVLKGEGVVPYCNMDDREIKKEYIAKFLD